MLMFLPFYTNQSDSSVKNTVSNLSRYLNFSAVMNVNFSNLPAKMGSTGQFPVKTPENV